MVRLIEKIDGQEINQVFAASDFYQLLSLSLQWPTQELAEALLQGSYQSDALNILEELGCNRDDILQALDSLEELKQFEGGTEKLLEQMRQDYTRLFNHPVQPVIGIYQSMFTDSQNGSRSDQILFMNPVALHAENCYKEAGVRLTNTSKEPADHMATELEFMMYLYGKKGAALKEGNQQSLEKIEKSIEEFEKLHLLKWAHRFFSRLESESVVLPYQGIARLAKLGLSKVLKPEI